MPVTLVGLTRSLREGRTMMKVWVLRWIALSLFVCAGLGLSSRSLPAEDKRAEKNDGLSVTVAFGAGLNTLPAVEPSAPNNRILPPEIKSGKAASCIS